MVAPVENWLSSDPVLLRASAPGVPREPGFGFVGRLTPRLNPLFIPISTCPEVPNPSRPVLDIHFGPRRQAELAVGDHALPRLQSRGDYGFIAHRPGHFHRLRLR